MVNLGWQTAYHWQAFIQLHHELLIFAHGQPQLPMQNADKIIETYLS